MPRLPDALPDAIPDARAHAAHDLELVAAYAAGDATGADLEIAAGLVAGCAGCAALHHDLRLIAAALPALPAPVRSRDFRITPEQAASLRPTGWRAILGTFAGPRFRFVAPLGTGLATLGLAGILLGSLAGAPLGAGTASTAGTNRDGNLTGAAASAQASAAPSAVGPMAAKVDASAQPAASAEPGNALVPVPEPTPTAERLAADSVAAADWGISPVALGSVLVLALGIVLVAARLLGRRLVRAR